MDDSITASDRELALVLWSFHVLNQQPPSRVDLVLVTGSHDLRVADRAAELMLAGVAPLAIASGGFGKVTNETNQRPEGEVFKARMVELGVDPADILVEGSARNTGDNFQLSHSMLDAQGINVSTGLIVTKPYMERRALATGSKQWAEVEWSVTSPTVPFDRYPTPDVPERRMINLMVGDLQRLRVFAEQGFQTPQDIPDDAWMAFESLRDRGFDDFVIRG